MTYDGATYYYILSLQGDVMGLKDSSSQTVVAYVYDAWGRLLETSGDMQFTLGLDNLLRYRGYVYDRETGLYYLESRYYNPTIGRFINADNVIFTISSLSGNNLFVYCLNNPISYSDDKGEFPFLALKIVAACLTIVGVDHALAAIQPDEGYAVLNHKNDNGTRKKGLFAEGTGFNIDENGMVLCDLVVGLVSFEYESDNLALDLLNLFTGHAIAELDWSGMPEVDISAVASIYSPGFEATLPLGIFSITFSGEAHLGAVGAGLEFDSNSGEFKFTPPMLGIGGSFGIDIDLFN